MPGVRLEKSLHSPEVGSRKATHAGIDFVRKKRRLAVSIQASVRASAATTIRAWRIVFQ
ncbi:MAG TPA: hypothetical protein P5317_09685 [Myxococcota bacterium]|nr:hypothetical protein [Myxococcota bacterium]